MTGSVTRTRWRYSCQGCERRCRSKSSSRQSEIPTTCLYEDIHNIDSHPPKWHLIAAGSEYTHSGVSGLRRKKHR